MRNREVPETSAIEHTNIHANMALRNTPYGVQRLSEQMMKGFHAAFQYQTTQMELQYLPKACNKVQDKKHKERIDSICVHYFEQREVI